jgi:riboflavin synthase
MFTGIVETVGTVERVIESGTNRDFVIRSSISNELRIDQSVSHNGVCLTIVAVNEGVHTVNAIQETLQKSNLGLLEEGSEVNLERCLKVGDRLDGHMVQGHVDTTVECKKIVDLGGSWEFHFNIPDKPELLVAMGSICLNGVSLTIAGLSEESFHVAIIPYTFEHTVFHSIRTGSIVNVEYDILGKYIQRQAAVQKT